VQARETAVAMAKPVMVRPGYYYPEHRSDDSATFLVRDFLVNFECPDSWRFDNLHGRSMLAR